MLKYSSSVRANFNSEHLVIVLSDAAEKNTMSVLLSSDELM